MDPTVFLSGQYVYLRPPDIERDVKNGKWFSWFNDKKVTRYLSQGLFPNTVDKQVDFVRSLKNDTSKVLLCVMDKSNDKHIGVVSFTNIDFVSRRAVISIVIGEKKYPVAGPLEAMALMTEYGFDRLNLNKIDAGQSTDLWLWVNSLELIGYRVEGYQDGIMIRDGKIHPGVHTGITSERFYRLREERGGNICGNDIKELLSHRCKENRFLKIKEFLDSLYNDYPSIKDSQKND